MATSMPIGLIDTSIGGTTVEARTPEEVRRTIEGAETKAMLQDWDDRISQYDPQADLKARIATYEHRINNLRMAGQPIPPGRQPPRDLRPGPVADRSFCPADCNWLSRGANDGSHRKANKRTVIRSGTPLCARTRTLPLGVGSKPDGDRRQPVRCVSCLATQRRVADGGHRIPAAVASRHDG